MGVLDRTDDRLEEYLRSDLEDYERDFLYHVLDEAGLCVSDFAKEGDKSAHDAYMRAWYFVTEDDWDVIVDERRAH